MNKEEIIDIFPHEEFRKYQYETIDEIIKCIENGEKNIILQADVGFGKSAVAKAIQQYIAIYYNKSTYIVTSSKYLQDQYLRDFKTLVTAKGRKNFECVINPDYTCEEGVCKTQNNFKCPVSYIDDCGELVLKEIPINSTYNENCPYWTQKIDAIDSYGTVLNYPYIMLESMFVNHFPIRKCLILDEAHNVENQILSMHTLATSSRDLKNDLSYTIDRNLPLDIINADWIDELKKIADKYKKEASNKKISKRRKEQLTKKYEKYAYTAKLIEQDKENWVIDFENNNVVFKPIDISTYAYDTLLKMGDIRIFMSGTILRPQYFAKSLGLETYAIVRPGVIVPPEKRPIIIDYVGSMSKNNRPKTIIPMVNKIKEIVSRPEHKNEKGIIHTYTYSISKALKKHLGNDPRFLFHESHDREKVTNKFKMRLDNSILVSPYSYEGVDFPYEQARFQLIVKQPFPFLSKQLMKKDEVSQLKGADPYLFVERCKILSQEYGRIVRSPDDFGVTYLLDLDLRNLIGDGSLASTYLWEGILDHPFNQVLEVNDASKASTGDELELVNDIKNGLNTITKLRDAYIWQVDGPSYKIVAPLVKKMQKAGILKS